MEVTKFLELFLNFLKLSEMFNQMHETWIYLGKQTISDYPELFSKFPYNHGITMQLSYFLNMHCFSYLKFMLDFLKIFLIFSLQTTKLWTILMLNSSVWCHRSTKLGYRKGTGINWQRNQVKRKWEIDIKIMK